MQSRAGELPLEIIRMKAKGYSVNLSHNEPGFTLPSNIGELGDDIVELNLSSCSLIGVCSLSTRSTSRALRCDRARRAAAEGDDAAVARDSHPGHHPWGLAQ